MTDWLITVQSLLVLADQSAISRSAGRYLTGADSYGRGWYFGLALAIAAGCWIALANWERWAHLFGSEPAEGPDLFTALANQHGLTRQQRATLWELGSRQQADCPTLVFLDRRFLDNAALEPAVKGPLLDRLFGE